MSITTATAPAPAPASPADAPSTDGSTTDVAAAGLGAEVRDSLLLLGLSLGVTVGLTVAGQAVLSALA